MKLEMNNSVFHFSLSIGEHEQNRDKRCGPRVSKDEQLAQAIITIGNTYSCRHNPLGCLDCARTMDKHKCGPKLAWNKAMVLLKKKKENT